MDGKRGKGLIFCERPANWIFRTTIHWSQFCHFSRGEGFCRLNPMSITAQDIKNVALTEDDFGHEMRVGKILRPENIQLRQTTFAPAKFEQPKHGETYIDAVTGKNRQFDYRTSIHRGAMGRCAISLAVECKNIDTEYRPPVPTNRAH